MNKHSELRGQSIIEFALIFPLLFFLITGLFDLGRAVLFMSTLNTAVRESTRWAIVQPMNTSINAVCKYVREKEFGLQALAGVVDETTPDYCNPTGGAKIEPFFNYDTPDSTITITATYIFVPITPGMKQLLGGGIGIPLKARSSMLLAPIAR